MAGFTASTLDRLRSDSRKIYHFYPEGLGVKEWLEYHCGYLDRYAECLTLEDIDLFNEMVLLNELGCPAKMNFMFILTPRQIMKYLCRKYREVLLDYE